MAKFKQTRESDSTVGKCMAWFNQDNQSHQVFCQKADTRYKAYRAILERRMDAAQWNSKNHPPYVFQIIETMTSGLLDANPKWRLRALPRMASMESIEMYRQGIKANELLLDYQLGCDHFVEKQRPFALQALITGLTVGKTYWRYAEGVQHSQQTITKPLYDDAGNLIGTTDTLGHVAVTSVVADDPTFEVVDVRDFIWHEAAVSLERADRVTHRLWFTAAELKRMVAAKRFNKVTSEQAIDELPASSDYGQASREQELFQTNRTKDMIEVLEMWIENGKRRVTIANRNLLLDDRPNPFWHGQFPFVCTSATPDMFRIPGISDVELINEIQEMMWTLQNQRLDAVQLLNNPVWLIRSDFDDPDSLDFFPGARNIVDDPSQVQLWTPPVLENRSIEHESMLKEDLQSIPGASPALLGQLMNSATTATEASLSSTLAMRRLSNKKNQLALGYARFGEQWIMLNQQFVTEDRVIPVIGERGEMAFHAISPLILQGNYSIQVEQLDQSQIRSERTAEAAARLQIALSAAPVLAALSQGGAAKMLNMDAFVVDYLESFDINDTDRYFTDAKPPAPPTPGGGQAQAPAGVSAPQATDQNSPSNAFSQSPVAMQQRQAAMTGGVVNGG